jgi:hypothetical protein
MGSNRSVLGPTLPLLVLTVVPSALVSAGATRAHHHSDGWPDLLVCGETAASTFSTMTRAKVSRMCSQSSVPR